MDTWEVLATWATLERSSFEALSFLRKALEYCDGKPTVYVDGGPWYRWPLDRLGIPWEHRTFGPRNPIEGWFGILKHRIKVLSTVALERLPRWCRRMDQGLRGLLQSGEVVKLTPSAEEAR